MKKLREVPPKKFGPYEIQKIRDYKLGKIVDVNTGREETTDLPTSNVLYYELNDDAWLCARPSGTEPKMKYYMGVKGISFEDAENKLKELENSVKK